MDFGALPWSELGPFIAIGFAAQLIESALGLGFGVFANALLVLVGLHPRAASSATHTVESFTSGITGLSHIVQGNVDWPLFARLVVPGVIGGFLGVWIFAVADSNVVRAIVLVYLAALGVYLIWRGARRAQAYRRMKFVVTLGATGGFLDASGGGWGPMVTGSLLAQGMTPRMAIGTVSASEFFVTVTVLAAFIGTLGAQPFAIATTGLLIGGIAGAPMGAWLTKRIPAKPLVQMVGIALLGTSIYGLALLMFEPISVFPRF